MTFSIVARCRATGQLGVGAMTGKVGVGKLVAHARARTGAVATQAMINPYLGFDGLALMAEGVSARDTLNRLLERDPGRAYRQCGLVDAEGSAAAWTGPKTPSWAGHRTGQGYSAQGNRLVGPDTLDTLVEAFHAAEGRELAERLLLGLEAGASTGGDRQGELSGAIYVVDTEQYPLWDARVDHSDDPVAELRALYQRFAEELIPVVRGLSTREDPLGKATRDLMRGEDPEASR
ncbi:MAG: DUF1028 domain-containing protein [Actinomycetota bacterium]|nr:DUF1028 domain-containing protein [Actinomycetota bacterium]